MFRSTFTHWVWPALVAAAVFLTAGPGRAAFHPAYAGHVAAYHAPAYHAAAGFAHPHYHAYAGTHYGYHSYHGVAGYRSYYGHHHIGYYPSRYLLGGAYYPYTAPILGLQPYYNPAYFYGSAEEDFAPYYNEEAVPVLQPDLTPAFPSPPTEEAVESLPEQANTTAFVTVKVPAGATVWFDGAKTTETGSVREYESPPLTPGHEYAYEIRAQWQANGQTVTQTRKVEVRAGAHVEVDFPVPQP